MKNYIYKYEIKLKVAGLLKLGGKLKRILHIAEQGHVDNEDSKLMLWAIVEPASKENSVLHYYINGTGCVIDKEIYEIPDDKCYRQTVLMSSGYVWHCTICV